MDASIATLRSNVAAFNFRGLHPNARFGTASDRYAGWIGQIYPEHWRDQIQTRKRTLGGRRFEERTLPVPCVRDYFEHFDVLELDFTFYRPLRDPDGSPSSNHHVLQQYAEHAPDDAAFLLKVPQAFFARKLRRSTGGKVRYEANPDFLNAAAYVATFHEPAVALLGDRLAGVIFEQEYQRKADSPSPEDNVAELDAFFRDIPGDVQPHLELRSEHLLVPPYFGWLADRGLGHVFSHWTWLPPLRKQWRMAGERFTAANGTAVTRLLTPLNVKYADAYARAHPFDHTVAAIAETDQARQMVLDVTALIYQALEHEYAVDVISNNRAWGNAPALAQAVATRVLDEEEKRA